MNEKNCMQEGHVASISAPLITCWSLAGLLQCSTAALRKQHAYKKISARGTPGTSQQLEGLQLGVVLQILSTWAAFSCQSLMADFKPQFSSSALDLSFWRVIGQVSWFVSQAAIDLLS